jgi:hypothetical protein
MASPPWLSAQFIIFATARGRAAIFPGACAPPRHHPDALAHARAHAPRPSAGGAYRLQLIEHWLNGTVPSQAPALIQEVRRVHSVERRAHACWAPLQVKANEGPGQWWNPVPLRWLRAMALLTPFAWHRSTTLATVRGCGFAVAFALQQHRVRRRQSRLPVRPLGRMVRSALSPTPTSSLTIAHAGTTSS